MRRHYELAPAGSASPESKGAAVSRDFDAMGLWFAGSDGSIQNYHWHQDYGWGTASSLQRVAHRLVVGLPQSPRILKRWSFGLPPVMALCRTTIGTKHPVGKSFSLLRPALPHRAARLRPSHGSLIPWRYSLMAQMGQSRTSTGMNGACGRNFSWPCPIQSRTRVATYELQPSASIHLLFVCYILGVPLPCL